MNPVSTQTSAVESPTDPTKDAFTRLTFLGWTWGLTAIVAGLAASFFLFGYALVYWRNADMDFMVVYNALLLNDGKPQSFFDHPAYLTILSVKSWFQLLHALGLLDAWSLSTMPPENAKAKVAIMAMRQSRTTRRIRPANTSTQPLAVIRASTRAAAC